MTDLHLRCPNCGTINTAIRYEIDRLRAQVAEGRELLQAARNRSRWQADRIDAYLAKTAT